MVVVVGPAWTASGSSVVDAGRFPLGVETATLANAARLVPAVTSITAHARYFVLHAHVVAQAAAGGVTDLDEVVLRVRRAETVLGALSLVHAENSGKAHHGPARLGEPHGAGVIAPALAEGVLDVEDVAGRYSRQSRGFLTAYRGSEIALGLLDGASGSLGPGSVRLSDTAGSALEPILALSRRQRVRRRELDELGADGCLCAVRSSVDGQELRGLMLGGAGAPQADADVRRTRTGTALSARLLVQAMDGRSGDVEHAMAALCCFSDLDGIGDDQRLSGWAKRWRGALLRNRSVTAWRWLWWWLTNQLATRPRTAEDLGDALAEALTIEAGGDRNAHAALTADLPERRSGHLLLDAESDLLYPGGEESWQPLDYLRCIALGALRIQDLTGQALRTFTEPAQFGPEWVREWLDDLGTRTLSDLGRELTGLLLRTAEDLSRRKARWEGSRLRLPTRLRPIGDVLHLAGREGSIPAGLRLRRLADVLTELDFVRVHGSHWRRGPVAAEWGW